MRTVPTKKDNEDRRLLKLESALKEWRSKGRPGRKIPKDLWAEAVALAERFGVGKVARALGLDHAKLKRFLEEGRAGSALLPMECPPTFVEFMGSSLQGISCVVEVNSVRGGHMRATVNGLDASGLSTLFREFGSL